MSDIFYEINESIKEDRLVSLWKKSRNFIIGLAIAILIITATYVGYDSHKVNQGREDYQMYKEAMIFIGENENAKAIALLDKIIQENHSGFAKLAQLLKIKIAFSSIDLDAKAFIDDAMAMMKSYSHDLNNFMICCYALSSSRNHDMLSGISDSDENCKDLFLLAHSFYLINQTFYQNRFRC